ncbi:spermidine synthase [Streptomyces solicathayae]|uniref:Polyamine aminopropyltransferase n=1 Tax=Streptomyces solicathayae TaxID=3081768 RepID=A0ABZ0LU82_9ACTN|nr:spermidine synthase [Streptomyces sp. HUAS YS2]WOX23063.1 spermidine synthase [Streptomyces sp. HUAS YS2]
MIDPPVSLSPKPAARLPELVERRHPRPSPVRPREVRYRVLAVVFVCAACGLVYELELVALASYLIGDSVTQASVVLSVMVFAMGVGSLLAKRLRCRAAVGFGLVEAGLALIGGCSALVLYAAFAWLGEARYVLVAFSLAIGVLIGAEIPLLMALIQRAETSYGSGEGGRAYKAGAGGRAGAGGPTGPGGRGRGSRRRSADGTDDAAGTVADLFAADYVGALVGGLAFPFLLLPWLGQLTGALVTGAVNAVAGGALVLWLFRHDLTSRTRAMLLAVNVGVLAVLATATVLVDDFERAARQAVYGDSVRVAARTDLQEVVVTGERGGPAALFMNGTFRTGGGDAHLYPEALVHPAMNGPRSRVLILGGGDGLAAREVLRYPDVTSVTVVELDPGVVRLARTSPELTALNGEAYADPRVRVVYADAFRRLRAEAARAAGRYDVVVSDLPDPGITASTKLYSEEFYGLAARVLAPGGRMAVHAGSATARPGPYWTVEATLRSAGLATRAYGAFGTGSRAGGRASGERASGGRGEAPHDWGFVLASAAARPPALALPSEAPHLQSLTARALASGARRVERTRGPRPLPPSTLVHPRYGG